VLDTTAEDELDDALPRGGGMLGGHGDGAAPLREIGLRKV
jgi:hypothetical protein